MIPIGTYYIPQSREERELQFSAEMTQHQFEALECKLDESLIVTQLHSLDYLNRIRLSSGCSQTEVKKRLLNSWNTERLLRFTNNSFSGNSLSFAIQWAFPQIYYSAFSSILAYFEVVGFTERKHTTVIRKFGMLLDEGKYPSAISFYASGGKGNIQLHNINHTPGHEPIRFVSSDSDSVNNQICGFLRATRKIDLDNKKPDIKIRKKSGEGYKINFNSDDWEYVSTKFGFTGLLSLLYRKRLKSNYRDIDTFLSEHLDAKILFTAIVNVINMLNLIHETFIMKGIGVTRYNQIIDDIDYDFVQERKRKIVEILR